MAAKSDCASFISSDEFSLKFTSSSSDEGEDEFKRECSIRAADNKSCTLSEARSSPVFDINQHLKKKISLLMLHAPDCDDRCCQNENGAKSPVPVSLTQNTANYESLDTPFQAFFFEHEYRNINTSSDESEVNFKCFKKITKKQEKLFSSDEESFAQEKKLVERVTRSCNLKIKQSRRKQSLELLKLRRSQVTKSLVPYVRRSVSKPPKRSGTIREKLCKLKLIRAVGKS